MMHLHWSPRSPFVRKVEIVAHETGLTSRIRRVRSVTGMLEPNAVVMRANPWNKIPTLILEDGRALFDSDVICEYLDSLHGGPRLIPGAPELRWPALRWRAFGNEMLDALILLRNERMRLEIAQLPRLIEVFELKLRTGLDLLETESPELAAAAFSLGHVAIGCALGYLDFRFTSRDWRSGRPRLAAWYEQFARRPAAIATWPVDDSIGAVRAAGERP